MEKITGVITRITYMGTKNYAIVNASTSIGKISVKGIFPTCVCGFEFVAEGEFNKEEKEFEASKIIINTSDMRYTVINFISSDFFSGIGETAARKLIDAYGLNFDKFMKDKDMLVNAKIGLNEAQAERITKEYHKYKNLYPIYYATKGNITTKQAETIYAKYKNKAQEILQDNPYKLIYDLPRFGFLKADSLARKAGMQYDSPERILAATSYVLKQSSEQDGSCYMTIEDLKNAVLEIILAPQTLKDILYMDVFKASGVPTDTPEWDKSTLRDIVVNHKRKMSNIIIKWDNTTSKNKYIKENKFTDEEIETLNQYILKRHSFENIFNKIINEKSYFTEDKSIRTTLNELMAEENRDKIIVARKFDDGSLAIYEKGLYLSEIRASITIVDLLEEGKLKDIEDSKIENAIKRVEEEESVDGRVIKLDKEQIEAIYTSVDNRISLITGGPGRGKTSIIKAILYAWEDDDSHVYLLAPTGKAAKRMKEATNHEAYTVARFLIELKKKSGTLTTDNTIIILDETSMVGLKDFTKLITSTKKAQFVFVGDPDQLPSVSAGEVLKDMIDSDVIPTSRLITSHRNFGSIEANAKLVNEGAQVQAITNDYNFKTWWSYTPDITYRKTIELYKEALKNYPLSEIIILTPMKKNLTGVASLNKTLQRIVNPQSPEKSEYLINIADRKVLRTGDRVYQITNNYEINAFNGETGTITYLDPFSGDATVKFDDDKVVNYTKKEIKQLDLAYALTYHKSQGSQFKCVFCLLEKSDFILLSRKTLYTGITRAKDKCYMIGNRWAFQTAINNINGGIRKTSLNLSIAQDYKEMVS